MKRYLPLNLSELLGIVGTASLIFTFAKEFGTQVSTAIAISVIATLVVAFTVAISLWQREGVHIIRIVDTETASNSDNIWWLEQFRDHERYS